MRSLRKVLWFVNGSERIRRRLDKQGREIAELQRDSLAILSELRTRLVPDRRTGQHDAISELSRTLDALVGRLDELAAGFSPESGGRGPPRGQAEQVSQLRGPRWALPNFTEPRVQVALRDLCRPGETVFDVGANFGGITVAMSRSVGPRGAVCAFEANPGLAERCQSAVIDSGCSNVQIFYGAVYSRSGERIDLYLSENQVSDSIYHKGSGKSIQVPTIALDDFVEKTGLTPSVVKMDIEGAEFDALAGFSTTIDAHKPVLILEQTPTDARCFEFLRERGYAALDLSTYDALGSMADLPAETVITDILYAPPERLEAEGYRAGTTEVMTFESKDFVGETPNILKSRPVKLAAGRYVVKAVFSSGTEDKQELLCGIWSEAKNEAVMQHHGHSDSLPVLAHRWVFDAPDGEMTVFFHFPGRRPDSFRIDRVTVLAVDALVGRPGVLLA